MLERHLAIGVRLADDGLIEPVIVEEVAGNPHARQRDARFVLHCQLGLRLGGPLIAKGRALPFIWILVTWMQLLVQGWPGTNFTKRWPDWPMIIRARICPLAFIGPTVVRTLPA